MEEKNKKEKKVTNDSQKLTYEQLEQVANNLNNQCKQMYDKLMEAQKIIADFNEIGMLLSIIEVGENFDSEFINRCSLKIQETVSKLLDKADKLESEKEESN